MEADALADEKKQFFAKIDDAQKACDCEWESGITICCLKVLKGGKCPRHAIMGWKDWPDAERGA